MADQRLSGIKCACCGKMPDIMQVRHFSHADPGNKKGLQYDGWLSDFHWHHLIYKDKNFDYEIGVWLCYKCHSIQKPNVNKTPINRFLRLMETTKIESTKEWCIAEIRKLKESNKGRLENKWDSTSIV